MSAGFVLRLPTCRAGYLTVSALVIRPMGNKFETASSEGNA